MCQYCFVSQNSRFGINISVILCPGFKLSNPIDFRGSFFNYVDKTRAATAGKAPKAWALPRFWVLIRSYKKQPVKKNWSRILGLAWLKFAVAALKTR